MGDEALESEEETKFRCKHYKRKCQFVVSYLLEAPSKLSPRTSYANMQLGVARCRCNL